MKIKRVKTGDRKYNLVDVVVGDVVATAVQTGERGRDNYPWEWALADDSVEFGDSGLKTGGVMESLKNIVDYVEANASHYGLTYRKDLRDRDAKREDAIAKAEEENKKAQSALRKMVRKLDARNKRTSQGYVTNRDELMAILSELTPLLSVAILEEERPYSVQHKEISVTIKLGFTLERDLL